MFDQMIEQQDATPDVITGRAPIGSASARFLGDAPDAASR
jgi:hypothetical protein